MKKYLLVLAAALVTFVSCEKKPVDPKPQDDKYTSISFKDAEVTIAAGESVRLRLLWEPAEIEEAPAVTWATSDSTVATVNNGAVTGIGTGEATITAKHGDLTATCKVTVSTMYDLIEWTGMSWWSAVDKQPLTNDTIKVTLTTGQEVSCVPSQVYFRLWGEGLYYSQGMKGEGIETWTIGMGLLITDDLGQGPNYYILGVDQALFVDGANFDWKDTANLLCCPTGYINGTVEQWYTYLTDDTEEFNPVQGSTLRWVNYDGQEMNDGFIGMMGAGLWEGDDEVVTYANGSIEWFNGPWSDETPSYYGILLEQNEQQEWDWSDPKVWAPTVVARYNIDNTSSDEAPKYKLIPADREVPEYVKKSLDPKVLVRK